MIRSLDRACWRLAGLVLALLTAAMSAMPVAAQSIAPPVQLPTGTCATSQLAPSFVSGEGAAGTLFATLQLANVGTSPCMLNGYVTVQMFDSASAPMPTVDRPGGGMLSGRPGPSPVTLNPGDASQFVIAWSDVPVGSETTCSAAATLGITPPGAGSSLTLMLPPPALAPCDGGRIDVSPLRAPGVAVP
jgi:hypothetical protein